MTQFTELKSQLDRISQLNKATAVLLWDQATYMPSGGAKERGDQMAALGQLAHEMFTKDEMGELLDRAGEEVESSGYDSDEASIVRVTKSDYDRARKLPTE